MSERGNEIGRRTGTNQIARANDVTRHKLVAAATIRSFNERTTRQSTLNLRELLLMQVHNRDMSPELLGPSGKAA
jgi:hypothetical protein